jgi:putative hydrolase of the HAD superfamily
MKKIKNIIFDLGGVILNINPELTLKAFKSLNFNDFDKNFMELKKSGLFKKFETADVSASEFRNEIKKFLINPVSDEKIDYAWNKMLLDFPKERIDLLRSLKKQYRTFLLSNTNEIHLRSYFKTLENNYGIKNMSSLFEKEYYSHELGLRKPNLDIYQFVLKDSNLNPNETLFIDDMPKNIEAAKKVGIKSHLLLPNEEILGIMNNE